MGVRGEGGFGWLAATGRARGGGRKGARGAGQGERGENQKGVGWTEGRGLSKGGEERGVREVDAC